MEVFNLKVVSRFRRFKSFNCNRVYYTITPVRKQEEIEFKKTNEPGTIPSSSVNLHLVSSSSKTFREHICYLIKHIF